MSTLVADRRDRRAPRRPIEVAHLLASRGLAGKERQLLQLLARDGRGVSSRVLLFAERGHCRPLAEALSDSGMEHEVLPHDTPWLRSSAREVAARLMERGVDVLCTHDYKSNLVGLWAARRAKIGVVAVFHGHTAEDRKVRLYEALDRRTLRRVDRCVCVSRETADRVLRAGVAPQRIKVIRNAVACSDAPLDPRASRAQLAVLWPSAPKFLVGAAGRLSREKGFDLLIDAARTVVAKRDVGIAIFGEGPLRGQLGRQIAAAGLQDRVVLAGQRGDLRSLLPGLDALVVPSRTEGLPTIVLEGMAAGVPIVAAAVGGVPEALDGDCGRLVPPERAERIAESLLELLDCRELAEGCRQRARVAVARHFSADRQAREHHELYAQVAGRWSP